MIKVCLEPEEIIRDAANRPSVNVALVLDKSGSMSGEKIAQAKEAAVQAIRRLGTKDLVSIVLTRIRLIPLLRHRRQGMSANLKISYETASGWRNGSIRRGQSGSCRIKKEFEQRIFQSNHPSIGRTCQPGTLLNC